MMEILGPPLARWLFFAGVLLLTGVVAWRGAVVPRLRLHLGETHPEREHPEVVALERRMAGAGALLSLLLLVAWGLRLWIQLQEFRDPFAPLSEDLAFLIRNTFWGTVWMGQGVLLALVGATFLLLRGPWSGRPPPPPGLTPEGIPRTAPRALELPGPWWPAAGGVMGLSLSLGLTSHAMSVPVNRGMAVALDAGHILAGGAWVGTLALILTLSPRPGPGAQPGPRLLAAQLRAFSPLAMVSVGGVVFLGVILSGLHLHEWAVLWREPYGRTLSLKILAALGVMGMGWVNWRLGLPRADTPGGARWVRRSAWMEVAAAAVVLLLTALLVATPLPPGAH
jgi:putative copper export protein